MVGVQADLRAAGVWQGPGRSGPHGSSQPLATPPSRARVGQWGLPSLPRSLPGAVGAFSTSSDTCSIATPLPHPNPRVPPFRWARGPWGGEETAPSRAKDGEPCLVRCWGSGSALCLTSPGDRVSGGKAGTSTLLSLTL